MDIGDSAWTPEESNYYQFLTLDLGGRFEIRSIATQGRSRSSSFVTEYIVQISDDGDGWRSVTDPFGQAEVLLSIILNTQLSIKTP